MAWQVAGKPAPGLPAGACASRKPGAHSSTNCSNRLMACSSSSALPAPSTPSSAGPPAAPPWLLPLPLLLLGSLASDTSAASPASGSEAATPAKPLPLPTCAAVGAPSWTTLSTAAAPCCSTALLSTPTSSLGASAPASIPTVLGFGPCGAPATAGAGTRFCIKLAVRGPVGPRVTLSYGLAAAPERRCNRNPLPRARWSSISLRFFLGVMDQGAGCRPPAAVAPDGVLPLLRLPLAPVALPWPVQPISTSVTAFCRAPGAPMYSWHSSAAHQAAI
mmetsp:Transcript_9686/g.20658  ORF Transcript_9686/g.20658 Transcript_9686/m.20658 type:complete len:276 (+) Transcript_9686:627-1454(+)